MNADLRQSDYLHAKVYIGQEAAIVTSANASANGLGLEGHEQACWLAMCLNLMIAVIAALSGFVGMLWLLLLWIGDGLANPVVPYAVDPIIGLRDPVAIYEAHEPFIPIPERLRTRDEMVAWMTQELPRLTAELPKSGG